MKINTPDIDTPDGLGDKVTYLLGEYRTAVSISGAALVLLFLSGNLGIPTFPSWIGLLLRGIVVATVPSTAGALILVRRFVPDPRERVLIIDPFNDGLDIGVAKVPSELWTQRIHDEDLPVLNPSGTFDAVVTQLDYDSELNRLEVRGTNPELADPAEIISKNGKLDATFSDLQTKSKQLEKVKATATSRERKVEEKLINSIIGAVESGSSIKPGLAEDEIFGEVFDDIQSESLTDPGDGPEDLQRDDEQETEESDAVDRLMNQIT
jgi:hypothetical protein